MLWRFRRTPKNNGALVAKKSWRSSRKVVTSLIAGALTIAGGIGSLLMPEAHAYTADAFVMAVKTDNPGISSATSFTIPITGAGYSYNVDCNDDGVNEVAARTTSYTCIYGSPGTYTVAITGTFPRIYFNNAGDRQKLLEVKQWGNIAWTSMQNAFYGAINMHVTASDAPNLAGVTNMSQMFRDATSMNENINHWDTSKITNMSYLFSGGWWDGTKIVYSAFNQPLNNWNTSAVTNMSGMFSYATAFNQPLTNFNTSAVTNMSGMFSGASAFNQPLTNFNTSAVTNMSWMFAGATTFNQPLTNFSTSAVTNMSSMFYGASAFNQPLTNFNTSAVTNMSGMFSSASAFNQPLTNFNTSAVTNMSSMFYGASAFNQPLTNFNTSVVTDMSWMFNCASAFNQPLTNFDTSAVTNMSGMFDNSGYTTATYDQTLAHFASQTLQPNVTLGAKGIIYCNDTARSTLTSPPNNWAITDGGFCPPIITNPTDLSVVSSTTPTLTGTAKPNRTVHIDIDGAAYTTMANASGDYSFTMPSSLVSGLHIAKVRSIDMFGTPSIPTTISFYVHLGGNITLSGAVAAPTLTWPAVSSMPAGTLWQQTAADATSFSSRGSFGAASLNGKLWVIGGQGSARFNDVWSSPDGVTWTQNLANAPWSARNAHTVTAFNGKLWVMGGQTTNSASRLNDVWSSPDGVAWTQETVSAPWPARSAHETLVHDGKLWLIGGADTTDADLTDVWNSSDGINWTQVTSSANWPSRRGLGVASFDGKLWVMGGLINNWGTFENDVWSSPDGITWTEETTDAAWPVRASHQVEVFDDKMWVLGGSADDWDSEYSDVWFSENGKDWHRTTEAADWQARRGHSSAVFNDKLWVLGGRVGSSWTLSNDVWSAALPITTYTICWDTIENGCAQTAQTTNSSFTIPSNLVKGTWHFKVTASIPGTQGIGSYTATTHQVTDPVPTVTPLTGKPVIHPVTGAPSTAPQSLSPTLADASLSIASYDCSDLQTPSIRLVEPDGLKVPEANVTLLGGVGFSVGCTSNGKSADVSLALGTSYTNLNQLRAYKQTGAVLTDITNQVTFTNQDTNGTTKTVASYNLVDGGELDEDGVANGTLVDPIFIGAIGDAGGSLANTGSNIYLLFALAATLLTSAAAIWRRSVKALKRVSFR